jgi:DNA-binding NarL/FixJ family response regulator
MDVSMPGMNGLEATRHIKARLGAPYVIILTLYDHLEYRSLAEAAGADGFTSKSNFGREVLPLIHSLVPG